MTWRPLPTPPAEREPRRIAESLDRIAARLGAPKPSVLSAVFVRWTELVGPDLAAHATPRMLRDGVLTVAVDHPAWATSLRLLGADLLRRIAEGGDGAVTELVVQVDSGPRRAR
jgi:predicted nucleic acid-binding Zn ribbon protein